MTLTKKIRNHARLQAIIQALSDLRLDERSGHLGTTEFECSLNSAWKSLITASSLRAASLRADGINAENIGYDVNDGMELDDIARATVAV